MADDPNANPDPVADPPAPPANPPANEPPADPPKDEWDYERGMTTILKLREEIKATRAAAKDRDDLAAKLKAYEDAQLSEQEKLTRKLAEYEQREHAAAEKLRRANLVAELAKPEHAIVNAQAAAKLIEGVEYNDDGEPTNLGDILAGFLDANGFLRGRPSPATGGNLNAGAGNRPGPEPTLTAEQLEWAGRLGMPPERYAAYLTEGATSVEDFQRIRQAEKAAASPT